MTAPFGTEADAMAAACAAAGTTDLAVAVSPGANLALLGGALAEAGVVTGAFEDRTVGWLAEWGPVKAAVIARWIVEAHANGMAEGAGNG